MSATGGGTRVNAARRALAGAAVAACLAVVVGTTVSYRGNRLLLAGALTAAREAGAAPADPAGLAPAEALRRLDGLRARTATLAGYERGGRPLRLGWGLYAGSRAFPALRRTYFDRFEGQLWARTRPRLAASLRALPEAPAAASEYGTTYDDLKAYLVTTSHPGRSTPAFLAPVLERHWAAAGEADPERRALARRQFAFFAGELPHGSPFPPDADEALVAESRAFLGRFAQVERFYRALLDEADRNAAPVDFARVHPGAVATAPHVVPGAFTRQGWAWVRGNTRSMERLFAREDWVLGPSAVGATDRERLSRELQARYVADYVAHWRAFLEAAHVAPFAGLGGAAASLGPLSGNDSPVLGILALASQHTQVDSVRVDRAFQPVHRVVPPGQAGRVAAEGTGAYLVALGGLRSALQQAVATPSELRAQPLALAGQAVAQADGEVRRLAQGFRIDGQAGAVGAAVQRLLLEPVDGARRALGPALASLPRPDDDEPPAPAAGAEANAAAGQFCASLRQLQGRFPFRGDARQEASVGDLQGVFQPGASAFAELEEAVRPLVSRQGPRYVARAGAASVPGSGFLRSLTQASELSRALFDEGDAGPRVAFTLRPHTSPEVPEVTVTVDGRRRRFTRTLAASESFTWHAADGGDARVAALAGGAEVTVAEAQGPWAVFRVFRGTTWVPAGDGRWTVTWRLPGGAPLSADVVFAKGTPVFSPAYLERLTCASRITS
jgi:type VI secretion system protein ImpL